MQICQFNDCDFQVTLLYLLNFMSTCIQKLYKQFTNMSQFQQFTLAYSLGQRFSNWVTPTPDGTRSNGGGTQPKL